MNSYWLSFRDFLNEVGVDTHITYTDGSYANVNAITRELKYLGITQIRDGVSDGEYGSASLSSYIQVAEDGIKFIFNVTVLNDADLSTQLALIDKIETAVPGSVVAIEGANEVNNIPFTFDGISGLAGAIASQQALYKAVHDDPALAGVAVDYFTGYGAGSIAVGPDPSATASLADYDNQHPYPNFNQAPAAWVSRSTALENEPSRAGPVVYTETGYSSNNVSLDVQAKYELDLLMDTASQGISKTFLYELLDAYAPGSSQDDAGWGLFDYTGAAKPIATAIHNLTTLVAATGTLMGLEQLNYTISGLPSTGNSLGITKSNGSDIIVVWNEPEIWNNSTSSEIAAPIVSVTVDLGHAYSQVLVFDPLVGTSPFASYANTEFVPLGLTDHPLLVEVSGSASTSTTTPSATTVGTGPDTLVLYVSEAAIGGKDAQFVVAVDGKQLGGVQTVTAVAAQGQQQTLTLLGSFGAGPHTVSVTMLDGFTGNAADFGRTLCVSAISLNGQTSFPNANLQYDDPWTYTVQTPAAPLVSNAGTQDTLVFSVAETAIGGQDARFLVSVDGQVVGGVETVTASYAAGASQSIALTGNFGSGSHVVAVDFINGFSGNAADVGRTLYLNAITLDGVTTTENAIQLYNGAPSYRLTGYTLTGPSATSGTSSTSTSTGTTGNSTGGTTSTPAKSPISTTTPSATTVGTGPDTLVLYVSEAAIGGKDAQFVVAVDGKQLGGVQTVTAVAAQGQQQTLTLLGSFGAGPHTVSVTMLDGFTGNAADFGRTLCVSAISLNGQTSFPNANLQYDDPWTYTVQTPAAPLVSNAGTQDTLVFSVAETAIGGQDARFLVSVDGQVVGGVETVTASYAAGASQSIALTGNFGSGSHVVAVDFINGFSGNAADVGRTLYLNAITLDGVTTTENAIQLYNGAPSYRLTGYTLTGPSATSGTSSTSTSTGTTGNSTGGTTSTPAKSPISTTTPSATTVGTGPDTLVLYVSEAAIGGKDAQFVVAVDGKQLGGVQTVTAVAAQGQQQTLTLLGSFGAGPHTVSVTMLDGFTGNAADFGRTLCVSAISLNGQTSFPNANLQYDDPWTYTVQTPAAPLVSNAGTQDTLVFSVAETAIGGQDARFLVSVDGQVVGGVETVTASYAAGASQSIALTGNFGSGSHVVAVDFINGFSGNAADVGRTLYLNAITLDGVTTTENAIQLYNGAPSYRLTGYTLTGPSATSGTSSTSTSTGTTGNSTGGTTSTPAKSPISTTTLSPSTPPSSAQLPSSASATAVSGNVPVTYNWNPATQLTYLLAAEQSVQAGVTGARAKIIALGDSTTVGVVGTPGGRGTASYPAQLAAALSNDRLSATSNNFLGGGLSVDSRVTLLGGAVWSGAEAAGGQLIQTSAAGQGATFTPITPVGADRVEIDYANSYNATFIVSVNGGPALATVQTGNTQTLKSMVVDLPAGQINSVTVQAATSNAFFLEGLSLFSSTSPAIEVYNAGKGGEDSGVIGSGSLTGIGQFPGAAAISPNLALIDYGINDIVNGTETISQTVANIEHMVDSLKSINCDSIVLIPTPVSGYQSQYASLRSALETMSQTMNIPLIDLSATYGDNEPALAAAGLMIDGLHPAPALYADIGGRIANLLTYSVTGTALPVMHIGP